MNKYIILTAVLVLAFAGFAGATTTTNSDAGTASYSAADLGYRYVLQGTASFTNTPAAASNDQQVVVTIASNTVVEWVAYRVLTAEGSTCLVDIGDNNSTTQYLVDVNANSTPADGASLAVSRRYFDTDGDIRVKTQQGASNAIIHISVGCSDVHRR